MSETPLLSSIALVVRGFHTYFVKIDFSKGLENNFLFRFIDILKTYPIFEIEAFNFHCRNILKNSYK